MGAAEAVFGEDLVGVPGEVPVGEIQEFDPLAEILVAKEQRICRRFRAGHIDLYARK